MAGLPFNFFLGNAVRLESASATGTVYATLFLLDMNANLTRKRFKTTNGGQTWNAMSDTTGTPELRSWHVVLAVDPNDANHVFANDAYTMFESTDGGKKWKQAEKIGDDWVNMTFDANNNGVVTADRNIYTYNPKTKIWIAREGNLQVTQFYDITLDPQKTDRAYGIAQDHVASMKFTGSILWDFLPGGSGETGRVLVDPTNSNQHASIPRSGEPRAPLDQWRRIWKTILVNNNFQSEDYALASVQRSFAMDPLTKRLLIG
jgi:hypothetical protein